MVAMAIIVLLSNILVQYGLGKWLTWGALTYPFAFLVTDLVNRLAGPGAARRVVVMGFVLGLFCSFVGTQIDGEFGPLVTLRIAIGSGVAFLVAQLLDVAIFHSLRRGAWWKAPVVSSFLGSMVDTALFFFIAFSGALSFLLPGVDVGWANETVPLLGIGAPLPFWVSLAVADFCVKLALALIALVPFKVIAERFGANQNAEIL